MAPNVRAPPPLPQVHKGAAPVVSVITPTFNRVALLQRALDSLLAQTYRDWELLVVDDGSTDGTFAVVDALLRADSRVRYLRHSNRRQSLSRNAGLLAAVGRYVTFLDSDDEYRPEHLASRVAFLDAHPELDLVQGGFEVDGEQWVVDFDDPTRRIHIDECALGPTFFGRREAFLALSGYQDGYLFEDTEFWRRAQASKRVQSLREPRTYFKHQTDDNLTAIAQRTRGVRTPSDPTGSS